MRRLLVGPIVAVMMLGSACGGSDATPPTSAPSRSPGPTPVTAPPSPTAAPTPPAPTVAPTPTVPAPELGGTEWNVTDYRLPNGSLTNVWKTAVTISFSADGAVTGSAGCNDYQGTWTVSGGYDEFESGVPDPNDGQELVLDSLSWTEKTCDDEAIMEQEREILDLLLSGGRWVLIRGNFNLRDGAGQFLFEAEPG